MDYFSDMRGTECGDMRIRLYVFIGGAITDDRKFVIEPSTDMERLT